MSAVTLYYVTVMVMVLNEKVEVHKLSLFSLRPAFDLQAQQEQKKSRRGVREAQRQPGPAALPAEHSGREFNIGLLRV